MRFLRVILVFVAVVIFHASAGIIQTFTQGTVGDVCYPRDKYPAGLCCECDYNTWIVECSLQICSTDIANVEETGNSLVRPAKVVKKRAVTKRAADDYKDNGQDYQLPKEFWQEIQRQNFLQQRQQLMDQRREAADLAAQQKDLAGQAEEVQKQLEYQQSLDDFQRQLDDAQRELDAQQEELDRQQTLYDLQQEKDYGAPVTMEIRKSRRL